jgi:uncharacterized protein YbjT (DUF2867 family)
VQHVVTAAERVGAAHLVYISIVGVDRVPLRYYRRKLADERVIAASGVPWTVLRATQFHDLIAALLRYLAKPPLMALPARVSCQPVDAREVGIRVADLALGTPLGRASDFAGPQVRTVGDLAGSYLSIVGKRRLMAPIWLPGKAFSAYRAGGHLAPQHAVGRITFEQCLAEQLSSKHQPYRGVLRDYLRLPPREVSW